MRLSANGHIQVTTILAAARLGINVVNAKDFDSEIELA